MSRAFILIGMKSEKTLGVTGRPRCFCVHDALDKALEVFWEKGYEGASLTDLTEAMGINRPSLYAAYGNKEQLFAKVLDRYAELYGSFISEALARESIDDAVHRLLYGSAHTLTQPDKPHGCLGVQGALSCGEAGDFAKQELIRRRELVQGMVLNRLRRAVIEGEIPEGVDLESITGFLMATNNGMSVQATGGATREDLEKIAEIAHQAFRTVARLQVTQS